MYGSVVAVPLQSADSVTGVLTALRRAGAEPFHPAEVPLLTSFAQQAMLALDLEEKNRAQRQLDVFADRDRIARDLHDHVIQRLFATGLRLQSTLRRIPDPAVQERVTQAVEDLDTTIHEIRTAIFDLHSTEDDTGLRRTLLDTAAEAAAGSAVSPSVRIAGPIETVVPPHVATHAVAVVREAISNAVRHGHAARITLTVEVGDGLVVDVLDDGVGIPADVGPQRPAQPGGPCPRMRRAAQRAPGRAVGHPPHLAGTAAPTWVMSTQASDTRARRPERVTGGPAGRSARPGPGGPDAAGASATVSAGSAVSQRRR